MGCQLHYQIESNQYCVPLSTKLILKEKKDPVKVEHSLYWEMECANRMLESQSFLICLWAFGLLLRAQWLWYSKSSESIHLYCQSCSHSTAPKVLCSWSETEENAQLALIMSIMLSLSSTESFKFIIILCRKKAKSHFFNETGFLKKEVETLEQRR